MVRYDGELFGWHRSQEHGQIVHVRQRIHLKRYERYAQRREVGERPIQKLYEVSCFLFLDVQSPSDIICVALEPS